MSQWWILGPDRNPIGPLEHDLVMQGIVAGRIPPDALICEVGGAEWVAIRGVQPFTKAFAKLRIDGPTMIDPIPELPAEPEADEAVTMNGVELRTFDGTNEHTMADAAHELLSKPLSPEPRSIRPLQRFDDVTEATVVEEAMRLSEPPR